MFSWLTNSSQLLSSSTALENVRVNIAGIKESLGHAVELMCYKHIGEDIIIMMTSVRCDALLMQDINQIV
jgi:hypothetical protein